MDRNEILLEHLEIKPKEVDWCFISDYYDGPIGGLVYYKNKILFCCCFPEDVPEHYTYVILKLSKKEIDQLLSEKERFEKMVGTQWSFDKEGNHPPSRGATAESLERYYAEKIEPQSFSPWNKEVVAWFTLG
ncbi:hypothetical protein [Pleionea sp. CnH1-48]|uniref:hypothetical protein n=1 Tax=Pleionea sp. CnH1-48 TaxID=2954494 RepID=UPI0020980AB8|nr:hypothetical protein [Pleionea sp. CnH1-48]MCO7222719.1 hypothetical protein [Pleionea sp. CnH1-48]